jgi:hypothetical protein
VDFSAGVPDGAGEMMIEAEMANLDPATEPHCVKRTVLDS